ncbi:M1 family metallopeptidase [candidate division KSB1 bacterium]|nr:M1 family metallopeptidase [candidate division KSB1 bacterium]
MARPRIFLYVILCFPMIFSVLAGSESAYWQQDVHYDFDVSLDVQNKFLNGDVTICYRNNSPDTLHELWLHLYPNAFKDEHTVLAKEAKNRGYYRWIDPKHNGYLDLKTVQLKMKNQAPDDMPTPAYKIDGTLMFVPLVIPLAPGEELSLYLKFAEKIRRIQGRAGYRGKQFDLAQWFPKLCVYDQKGWHADEFHSPGEFYGEFATFDVKITLPYNFIIAATGDVVEGDPGWEWVRVDTALSEEDWKAKYKEQLAGIEKNMEQDSMRVVKFHAENVHDFAWLCSPEFLYERGEYAGIPIHVLYRKSVKSEWSKIVVERGEHVLEWLVTRFGPYPYPQLSITHGLIGGGMEYPMLVMNSGPWEGLIAHEVGHIYFYGIFASDELADSWMDEGGTTYQERWYQETRYGKFGFDRETALNERSWLEKTYPENTSRESDIISSLRYMTSPHYEPISRYAHEFTRGGYGINAYTRGALFHDMLHKMVGDSVWSEIIKEYYRRWALKHVNEERFRKVCEDVSGMDLEWYFHQWLHDSVNVDYALKKTRTFPQKDGTWYSEVTIERNDRGIMPVDVLVKTEGGNSVLKRWDGKAESGQLTFKTTSKPVKFILDPDDNIMDKNRLNNGSVGIKHVLDLPRLRYTPRNDYLSRWALITWYNDVDGQWLGARMRGSYLDDYYRLNAFTSYGFISHAIDFGFQFTNPFDWNRRNIKYELTLIKKEGRLLADLGMKFEFTKRMYGSPVHSVAMGLCSARLLNEGSEYAFRKVMIDDAIQKVPEWEAGRINKLYVHYQLDRGSRHHQSTAAIRASLANQMFGSEFDFMKLEIIALWDKRIRERVLDIRLFGGIITGSDASPIQERYFIDGAGPMARFNKFYTRSIGALPAEVHPHYGGDGNLRGYFDQPLAVENIAAANVELSQRLNLPGIGQMPIFRRLTSSLCGFFDVGNAWFADDRSELLMDAGVGLDFQFRVFRKQARFRFDIPFWVSDPLLSESDFAFRWLIGLGRAL